GTNDVGNHDRARSYEADGALRWRRFSSIRQGKCGHPSGNFLPPERRTSKDSTPKDRTKGDEFIPVRVSLSYALLERFRQWSEELPSISFQQHERRFQAFRRSEERRVGKECRL